MSRTLSKLKSFFQNNRTVLSYTSTVIVIVIFYWYFYNYREDFDRIRFLNISVILQIFIIQFIVVLLMGLLNFFIIRNINVEISLKDSILLQYVNNLLNKILTKWGATYRAVYLKQNYQLPYSKFISSLSGYYAINFVAQAVTGLSIFLYIFLEYKKYNSEFIILYSVILIVSLIVLLFKPSVKFVENKVYKFFRDIILGLNVIIEKPKDIFIYSMISLTSLVFSSIQFFIIFKTININANAVSMIFLSTLAMILTFINITPDGFGIREWLYLIASDLIGISGPTIVLGSLILRAITLLSSSVYGGLSYFILKYYLGQRQGKES